MHVAQPTVHVEGGNPVPAGRSSTERRTVPDILIDCARHRPAVSVLVDADGTDLTAEQLLAQVRRAAGLLAERGVHRPALVCIDTVALSWAQVAVCYLSVVWHGAAAVLTAGGATERLAREQVGATHTLGGTGIAFAELISGPALTGDPAAGPDDLLDIVFTSGTTGTPKPVASRHAQWAGLVRPELVASRTRRVVAHTGIPIAVSGGVHGVLLQHLARGVTSRHADTVADLVTGARRSPVDELHLTPHAARGLTLAVTPGESWAARVAVIRIVGGPVPEGVAEALAERFPRARAVSVYALTEGGAALCVKVIGRGNRDSVGRPVGETQVRILDQEGRELPPGRIGELAVRDGDGGPLSYYRDDGLNREWFRDGWARTGDLGYLDATGEVRLVGRAKELLFLRGGRLPPEMVEEIMARRLPDVEFAVAGIPNPGGWDRIAAFVQGSADDPVVAEACRRLAAMTGPFRPEIVRVVPEIPRAPFGKPLRRELTADLVPEANR
jgi:long-chain acyl-CoA synthetase